MDDDEPDFGGDGDELENKKDTKVEATVEKSPPTSGDNTSQQPLRRSSSEHKQMKDEPGERGKKWQPRDSWEDYDYDSWDEWKRDNDASWEWWGNKKWSNSKGDSWKPAHGWHSWGGDRHSSTKQGGSTTRCSSKERRRLQLLGEQYPDADEDTKRLAAMGGSRFRRLERRLVEQEEERRKAEHLQQLEQQVKQLEECNLQWHWFFQQQQQHQQQAAWHAAAWQAQAQAQATSVPQQGPTFFPFPCPKTHNASSMMCITCLLLPCHSSMSMPVEICDIWLLCQLSFPDQVGPR